MQNFNLNRFSGFCVIKRQINNLIPGSILITIRLINMIAGVILVICTLYSGVQPHLTFKTKWVIIHDRGFKAILRPRKGFYSLKLAGVENPRGCRMSIVCHPLPSQRTTPHPTNRLPVLSETSARVETLIVLL